MPKAQYIGVNGVARKVTKEYLGVEGIARKVKKGYIGINGVARQYFSSDTKFSQVFGYEQVSGRAILSDMYAYIEHPSNYPSSRARLVIGTMIYHPHGYIDGYGEEHEELVSSFERTVDLEVNADGYYTAVIPDTFDADQPVNIKISLLNPSTFDEGYLDISYNCVGGTWETAEGWWEYPACGESIQRIYFE